MTRAKDVIKLFVLLLLIGIGCKDNTQLPPSSSTIPVSCEEEPVESESSQASQLSTVEIRIDGTPSMKGYVKDSNSLYVRTLGHLDSATSTLTTAGGERQFYKFGLTPQKETGMRSLVAAKEVGFYQGLDRGDSNFKNANIDAAIPAQPSADKVSILITDLYQQKTEIGLIKDKLTNYLNQDYAVGILAIRSQFKGRICDYNTQGNCFDYSSKEKGDSFHPFYVLFLGKYGYIEKLFNELHSLDSELFAKERFIVFYPRLVRQTSSLIVDLSAPQKAPGVLQQATMWVEGNGGKRRLEGDRQKIAFLGISGRKKASFSEQASYDYLPYALPIKTASEGLTEPFQVEPKVGFFQRTQNDFNFERSEARTVSQHINLTDWQLDPASQKIDFTMQIDPKQLPSGTYFVGLNLLPVLNRNNFSLSNYPWWEDWHTEGGVQAGNKTHNLKYFLDDLQGAMLEVMRIKKYRLGHLCYVVQKQN